MNTSALETFALAVRHQLLETVGRKLDFVLSASQVAALRDLAQKDRDGLIEGVAHTEVFCAKVLSGVKNRPICLFHRAMS